LTAAFKDGKSAGPAPADLPSGLLDAKPQARGHPVGAAPDRQGALP